MLPVDVEADFDQEALSRALAHLARAVTLNPENPRYRKVYAEALIAGRRFDEALAHLEPIHPERPEPRMAYLLALCQFHRDDYSKAFATLDSVDSELIVGFTRYHLLKGRLFFSFSRFEEATNEFLRAQVVNPAHREAKWWEARSLVAAAGWRGDDTTPLYRRALKILVGYSPSSDQVDEWHFLLGRVYLALRYPMEALVHLEKTRARTEFERQLLTGIAFLMNGDNAKASDWLAAASTSGEGRRRCEQYLLELAHGAFQSMRTKTASSPLPPVMIDDALLDRVFGRSAPEAERIRLVLSKPKGAIDPRTQAESADAPRYERLLAPHDAGQPGEGVSASSRAEAPNKSEGPPDKLHPQTWLEYDAAKLQSNEPPPDEVDTVIDDGFPPTREDDGLGDPETRKS